MIIIKNKEQIANITVAGNIIAQIFSAIDVYLTEGITTADIDAYIHQLIIKEGGKPAFLGHQGYSASTCISINEQIIHALPSPHKKITNGDLISIDVGVSYQNGIADSAYTFYLGENPTKDIQRLLQTTKNALLKGIETIAPKKRISDISKTIQTLAIQEKLGIVKEYCGHGVGTMVHESPEIPNYYPSYGNNPRLREGMVIAIEPMFTLGSSEISHSDDNFTVVSKDNSLTAHFEHTVLVTHDSYKILTI